MRITQLNVSKNNQSIRFGVKMSKNADSWPMSFDLLTQFMIRLLLVHKQQEPNERSMFIKT